MPTARHRDSSLAMKDGFLERCAFAMALAQSASSFDKGSGGSEFVEGTRLPTPTATGTTPATGTTTTASESPVRSAARTGV